MASRSMWLLLLLSWVASTEVLGGISNCAAGWFYHGSSCYGYFRKSRSWSDAELDCQSYGNGTHLASILNEKEFRIIAKYIRGYQRNQPVWIGLRDLQKKQYWQWIDGATYTNRLRSSPSVDGNKHCAQLSHTDNFLTWSSNECNLRQHFLCKSQP
ncbi:regenerating islet-derived protein 4 [Ochotona princeps]|uniref:regenerating islet-derived protein 4 n=1 Tax=Ochotona princeps TaxID=9978 RepID=UPI0001777D30|nr:regenerating islet-derived protein 4 [Ochotona princeps]